MFQLLSKHFLSSEFGKWTLTSRENKNSRTDHDLSLAQETDFDFTDCFCFVLPDDGNLLPSDLTNTQQTETVEEKETFSDKGQWRHLNKCWNYGWRKILTCFLLYCRRPGCKLECFAAWGFPLGSDWDHWWSSADHSCGSVCSQSSEPYLVHRRGHGSPLTMLSLVRDESVDQWPRQPTQHMHGNIWELQKRLCGISETHRSVLVCEPTEQKSADCCLGCIFTFTNSNSFNNSRI